jgi:hypothetical protein
LAGLVVPRVSPSGRYHVGRAILGGPGHSIVRIDSVRARTVLHAAVLRRYFDQLKEIDPGLIRFANLDDMYSVGVTDPTDTSAGSALDGILYGALLEGFLGQTHSLETFHSRKNVQAPRRIPDATLNDGSSVTSVTLQDRDGLVLIATAWRPISIVLREQLAHQFDPSVMANVDRVLAALRNGTPVDPVPPTLERLFSKSVRGVGIACPFLRREKGKGVDLPCSIISRPDSCVHSGIGGPRWSPWRTRISPWA